jgi:hypothetical protein
MSILSWFQKRKTIADVGSVEDYPLILSRLRVIEIVRERCCDPNYKLSPVLVDVNYVCPTRKWVKKYYSWYLNLCWDLGLSWSPDHDCDNFARLAAAYAQIAHFTTEWKGPGMKPEGLAFGEYFYIRENVSPHAINLVLVANAEPSWWEPQTGKELKLTKREIESCSYVRF